MNEGEAAQVMRARPHPTLPRITGRGTKSGLLAQAQLKPQYRRSGRAVIHDVGRVNDVLLPSRANGDVFHRAHFQADRDGRYHIRQ